MHSDFLEKFKGKTNKIPKEGVVNLIEATHKKPLKLVPSKPKDTKLPSSQKQTKNKKKQQKISPSAKQNKRQQHASYSADQLKRNLEKNLNKKREILSVKQNKKSLNLNINVKKQPLKLPKINKENLLHKVQSVLQNPKQSVKTHLKQNRDKTSVSQKPVQKLKRIMLTQVRQSKPEQSPMTIHGFESLLDDEALLQLKKLNNLELIVQQISLKRRQQMELQELHNSRYNRKGLTVHY